MKLYTIREAAEALGTNKTAIRRLMKQIPPEEISTGSYRGQPTILISQKGFDMLVSLQGERQAEQEADREAVPSESSAPGSETSAPGGTGAGEASIIAMLRAELEAKNQQIIMLSASLERAQEATAAAQALHAATAEQLRLLTAGTREERSSEREGPPQEADGSGGSAAGPTAEVFPEGRSFWQRLKYAFSGKGPS